ncbi:HNH endonuclease [Arthrobacter phage BruhMoment]|nr:HNH endonuclease [Arthrobacter phage BruhMoment]
MGRIELRRKEGASLWAVVDDADLPALGKYRWYANTSKSTTYAQASINENGVRRTIRMHKLLTGWDMTDHIDGDGLNNRRSNLRPATNAQNQVNSRLRRGNSQYRGVCKDVRNGVWKANINVSGRRITLGTFRDEVEAAKAYDAAATEHHGEFARLNFERKF